MEVVSIPVAITIINEYQITLQDENDKKDCHIVSTRKKDWEQADQSFKNMKHLTLSCDIHYSRKATELLTHSQYRKLTIKTY